MRARNLALLGLTGIGLISALSQDRDTPVSMQEHDWTGFESGEPRRYRSPGHALHHFKELALLSAPLAGVYILRAITPAFREQIMITTASVNSCPP